MGWWPPGDRSMIAEPRVREPEAAAAVARPVDAPIVRPPVVERRERLVEDPRLVEPGVVAQVAEDAAHATPPTKGPR